MSRAKEVRGTCYPIATLMHGGFKGKNNAFEEAVRSEPDFIGADAGSTDTGPAYLGGNRGMTHRWGVKQTLENLLTLCVPRKVPLLIGSAGMSGNRPGLAHFRELVEEVAREQGLHFKAAFIDSEVDKSYVRRRLRQDRIRPCEPLAQLTDKDIDRATHIVAMMGTEPYVDALDQGAMVIVGGRTTDPALFAAVPIWKGIPLNVAWHMAKVIDHGTHNIEPVPGVETWVMGVAADDHFRVEATNPQGRCSAVRTAHATMHENRSPVTFYEPPGRVDIAKCRYEQLDPRTVKVTGSEFTPLKYTLKLEGAEKVGYRSVTICGIRDAAIIANIDANLQSLKERVITHAKAQGIGADRFRLLFHVYGKGECMGAWETRKDFVPLEVGVLAECVADDQELAAAIMNMTHFQLHSPLLAAFPFSQHNLDFGPVYQFNICHLVETEDPMECSQTDFVNL